MSRRSAAAAARQRQRSPSAGGAPGPCCQSCRPSPGGRPAGWWPWDPPDRSPAKRAASRGEPSAWLVLARGSGSGGSGRAARLPKSLALHRRRRRRSGPAASAGRPTRSAPAPRRPGRRAPGRLACSGGRQTQRWQAELPAAGAACSQPAASATRSLEQLHATPGAHLPSACVCTRVANARSGSHPE